MARRSNRTRRREARRSLPTFSDRRRASTPSVSIGRRDQWSWADDRKIREARRRIDLAKRYKSTGMRVTPAGRPLNVGDPGQFKRHMARLQAVHGPVPGPIVINRPEKTVCDRRRERREVLFASGKGGKKGQKAPVWTLNSKVRCK